MVLGMVTVMDQCRSFVAVVAVAFCRASTMVLAIAPARVPVMDWMLENHMLEIARAFVMVVWMAHAMDWISSKSLAMASATLLPMLAVEVAQIDGMSISGRRFSGCLKRWIGWRHMRWFSRRLLQRDLNELVVGIRDVSGLVLGTGTVAPKDQCRNLERLLQRLVCQGSCDNSDIGI